MQKLVIFSSQPDQGRNHQGSLLTIAWQIVLVAITVSCASLWLSFHESLVEHDVTFRVLVVVLVCVVLLLYNMVTKNRNTTRKQDGLDYGVSICPLGVQVWVENSQNQPSSKGSVRAFVPRHEILDCIVQERILAHRVRNSLLFRLHGQRILEPFPELDLPYHECLRQRRSIQTALRDYGILQ